MTAKVRYVNITQIAFMQVEDLPDERSAALKVLHEALPEKVKDLPTSKQKIQVHILMTKLRSMV